MASYGISYTAMSVTFTVTGVYSGQVVRFFVRLLNDNNPVVDQQATASGSSITRTFPGLSPSTTYVANAGTVSGITTSWIGAQQFTTPSDGGGGGTTRPANWSWWSAIYSGGPVRISAGEWNAFCTRINEFRAYRGLSNYWFTTVYSGNAISADVVNQAWNAIAAMSGYLPAQAASGGQIQAGFFNGLASALNSIS